MNNRIVIVVSIALAVSVIVNGYLYLTLIETENDLTIQVGTLEIEKDVLNSNIDDLNLDIDSLQFELNVTSSQRDILQNERDSLRDNVTALTIENNNLIDQVNSLTDERDEALEEVNYYSNLTIALNTTVNELNSAVNTLTAEKTDLEAEIESLNEQIVEANSNITSLENKIKKFEEVLVFNTSNIETLVFHVSEKNWTTIPDINSTYNEILALNNNTYEIVMQPEILDYQNWTATLDWLNDNCQGKEGIPIMLEAFGSSQGEAPIIKLYPENITEALTTCNIKSLRINEVISWHMEQNESFPIDYVDTLLAFGRANNLTIFWTEWKTDYLPEVEVFTQIQKLIEGYEDIVTVSFSTNSGEDEPALGFLDIDERFEHWGASIQAWYWDTRYNESSNAPVEQDMPISLLIQHALAAKNVGAEILQFEPYWYFFNPETGAITENLELLFAMLK